jgi:hypothetical protein
MLRKPAIPWQVRIHLFLFVASLLWILVPAINKSPSKIVAQQASLAAAEFLYLVDTEEYAESWEVTSAALKDMLSQDSWNDRITELREVLGPVIERLLQDVSYTDSASDVPKGEYVVMTFVSKFELREKVVEKLTLMLGDDATWRVAGYFMR